jgi:hypothetical protein
MFTQTLCSQESPHVLVIWRPDLHQYTAYVTKEVDASVPSTGGIINLDLPKIATQALGLSLGAWQADLKVRKGSAVPSVLFSAEIRDSCSLLSL